MPDLVFFTKRHQKFLKDIYLDELGQRKTKEHLEHSMVTRKQVFKNTRER